MAGFHFCPNRKKYYVTIEAVSVKAVIYSSNLYENRRKRYVI